MDDGRGAVCREATTTPGKRRPAAHHARLSSTFEPRDGSRPREVPFLFATFSLDTRIVKLRATDRKTQSFLLKCL